MSEIVEQLVSLNQSMNTLNDSVLLLAIAFVAFLLFKDCHGKG